MLSFRGSSLPRDETFVSYISCIGRQVLYRQRHLGSPKYIQQHINKVKEKITPKINVRLLLLLLSLVSRVRLCATPQTAAHQAPPSLGFSRQERWSVLPFPSPMRESEVAQSCRTPSDPMDCSLPVSSIHGIFQARVLEWGAIASSNTELFVTRQFRKEMQPSVFPKFI